MTDDLSSWIRVPATFVSETSFCHLTPECEYFVQSNNLILLYNHIHCYISIISTYLSNVATHSQGTVLRIWTWHVQSCRDILRSLIDIVLQDTFDDVRRRPRHSESSSQINLPLDCTYLVHTIAIVYPSTSGLQNQPCAPAKTLASQTSLPLRR